MHIFWFLILIYLCIAIVASVHPLIRPSSIPLTVSEVVLARVPNRLQLRVFAVTAPFVNATPLLLSAM